LCKSDIAWLSKANMHRLSALLCSGELVHAAFLVHGTGIGILRGSPELVCSAFVHPSQKGTKLIGLYHVPPRRSLCVAND
jgi:hypothetical protein